MSDNPLESSPERDARIAAKAKTLWEEAGSPEGGEAEFQERADELVRMEMAGNPGQLPIETRPMVEEASIQENLGEFPGQQQDQGDRMTTPMTRADMRDALDEEDGSTTPKDGVVGSRVNPKAG